MSEKVSQKEIFELMKKIGELLHTHIENHKLCEMSVLQTCSNCKWSVNGKRRKHHPCAYCLIGRKDYYEPREDNCDNDIFTK